MQNVLNRSICFGAVAFVTSVCCLLIALGRPSRLSAQSSAPIPEYFGFYALDGGKLIAIGGGSSDTAPMLQQVTVLNLRGGSQRTAIQLSSGAHFLLFDVSPAEAARALTIFRLPYVRNLITVSDVPQFGSANPYTATASPKNMPGMMRLQTSQIRLLQKPVSSQQQMIELVANPPLAEGLYGVLFAPAPTSGGVGAGQNPGWTALLLVGQMPAAAQSGPCIDLMVTGGLGGMLGMDSPDVGSIASFPLLDPQRARTCSETPSAPQPLSDVGSIDSGAPNPMTANSATSAALSAAVERGEEIRFKVKYTDSSLARELSQRDGLVTLSKTAVTFQPTVGSTPFSVAPDKILELVNESQKAGRIRLKVAIIKNGKEEAKSFEFYHPGTFINGLQISCVRCDASMNVLYAQLLFLRDRAFRDQLMSHRVSTDEIPIDSGDIESVAAKLFVALGGKSKVTTVKNVHAVFTVRHGKEDITEDTIMVYPDELCAKLGTKQGEVRLVVTPTASFMSLGLRVQELPSSRRDEYFDTLKRDFLNVLQHLGDPKFKFTVTGKEKLGNDEATIVNIIADGVPTRWWIGADGKLLQEQYSEVGHSGPRTTTNRFSDWASFDGLNYPAKIVSSYSDDKNMQTATIVSMKINADIDPKLFEKP